MYSLGIIFILFFFIFGKLLLYSNEKPKPNDNDMIFVNSLTTPKVCETSKQQKTSIRKNNSLQNPNDYRKQVTKNFEDNFEKSTPDEKRNYFTHKTKTK